MDYLDDLLAVINDEFTGKELEDVNCKALYHTLLNLMDRHDDELDPKMKQIGKGIFACITGVMELMLSNPQFLDSLLELDWVREALDDELYPEETEMN